MRERWREAIEALPILLEHFRFELLPERRAGIGREQFELRRSGPEVDRVRDRRRNRRPVVLREPEHVERRRGDPLLPTMIDHHPLLRFGNRTTARTLERLRRQRFDAEADRTQTRTVERVEEFRVETIETRLAFERQVQPSRQDRLAQLQTPTPILREERVAEEHVRPWR